MIGFDAECSQPGVKLVRRLLAAVMRNDYTAHIQPDVPERIDQAQGIFIIGNAEISAPLGTFNIVRRNGKHDLRIVLHFQEHLYLAVRLKPRENARCVIIVKKLPAELQIQLPAEAGDPVFDALGLQSIVFCTVEAKLAHNRLPP